MNDCVVIIPTYNEKENIKEIIQAVFSLSEPFDIIVIDDNSPDGTEDEYAIKSVNNAVPE